MTPLPLVMVAPNGARLTKKDHPNVPIGIHEIVECAKACAKAGAGGIHAHVRDDGQQHVLDAGLYSELLAELDHVLPGFYAQITTESVGRYTAAEQFALVKDVAPKAVSIALREVMDGASQSEMRSFYNDCHAAGIDVQHILYDAEDIAKLSVFTGAGIIPREGLKTLLVLGRYTTGQLASPDDLKSPVAQMLQAFPKVDWAVCAFGRMETDCLLEAHRLGAKLRIGFENNRLNRDLSLADTNAERVRELIGFMARPTDGSADEKVA